MWPQPGFDLHTLAALPFRRFALQPLDGPDVEANTGIALATCLADPRWELSLQTHKITGIR